MAAWRRTTRSIQPPRLRGGGAALQLASSVGISGSMGRVGGLQKVRAEWPKQALRRAIGQNSIHLAKGCSGGDKPSSLVPHYTAQRCGGAAARIRKAPPLQAPSIARRRVRRTDFATRYCFPSNICDCRRLTAPSQRSPIRSPRVRYAQLWLLLGWRSGCPRKLGSEHVSPRQWVRIIRTRRHGLGAAVSQTDRNDRRSIVEGRSRQMNHLGLLLTTETTPALQPA